MCVHVCARTCPLVLSLIMLHNCYVVLRCVAVHPCTLAFCRAERCRLLFVSHPALCLSDMTHRATAGEISALERLKAAGVNQLSKGT